MIESKLRGKNSGGGLYVFTTHTFTTCGSTGRLGPTDTQITNTYTGTSVAGYVVGNSGGYQLWTAPSTGDYTVKIAGASGGGGGAGGAAGSGAVISSTLALVGGVTYSILVGQRGLHDLGGGGGGGSFLWQGTNLLTASAGGGGGGGGGYSGLQGNTGTSGSAGIGTGTATRGGAGGVNGYAGETFDNTGNSWDAAAGAGWYSDSTVAAQYSGTHANNAYRPLNSGLGGLPFNSAKPNNAGGFGGGGGGGGDANSIYSNGGGGGGYSGGGNGGMDVSENRGGGGGGGSYSGSAITTYSPNTFSGYITITLI